MQQAQAPQEDSDRFDDGEIPAEQPKAELPVSVKDNEDGTYLVTYSAPSPCTVCIIVVLDAQDGTRPTEIRGSPFTATFVEKPRPKANEFSGPNVTAFVANTINQLDKFCLRTESGLQASYALHHQRR